MSQTLELSKKLIACPSVTPNDQGCQAIIQEYLTPFGFQCETMAENGVTNLWARHGHERPLLVFAGHTDVVPPGPLNQWTSPPFIPTERNGNLYGRGASDMKVPVAAMIVAATEFIAENPHYQGSIAFLITSDEEGPATHGTVLVCDQLKARNEWMDYCIIGEPSSMKTQGDTVKVGRRGSLSAKLTVYGLQSHIAYPERAINPIHKIIPALQQLMDEVWDNGNEYYGPTTWQMSNIHAGTGANNVIPGEIVVDFNFRFSTENTPEQLKDRVKKILDSYDFKYHLDWSLSGRPFLTKKGDLCHALLKAIHDVTKITAHLSTTGGTSDGRFIADICPQVIEFGPLNDSIHQIDEHVPLKDIDPLKDIYKKTLENILLK